MMQAMQPHSETNQEHKQIWLMSRSEFQKNVQTTCVKHSVLMLHMVNV